MSKTSGTAKNPDCFQDSKWLEVTHRNKCKGFAWMYDWGTMHKDNE
jgi:hypothetical protein